VICFLRDQEKPLAMRTRSAGSGNLQLEYEDDDFPLRTKLYGREFGVGAANRVGAAVLYTGNATYAAPTLTY
jgi:hypothetical protein